MFENTTALFGVEYHIHMNRDRPTSGRYCWRLPDKCTAEDYK